MLDIARGIELIELEWFSCSCCCRFCYVVCSKLWSDYSNDVLAIAGERAATTMHGVIDGFVLVLAFVFSVLPVAVRNDRADDAADTHLLNRCNGLRETVICRDDGDNVNRLHHKWGYIEYQVMLSYEIPKLRGQVKESFSTSRTILFVDGSVFAPTG